MTIRRFSAALSTRAVLVMASAIVLSACSASDGVVAPEDASLTLRLSIAADASSGLRVGDTVVVVASVTRVRRSGQQVPARGELVNWAVASGGGSLFVSATMTNDEGEARNRWVVGTGIGDQRLEVRAVDQSTGEAVVHETLRAEVLGFGSEWILFIANQNPQTEATGIYATTIDGAEPVKIVPYPLGMSSDVSWSPERGRIAWSHIGVTGREEIWVANTDGAGARSLGEGRQPSWSRDGAYIAFMCNADRDVGPDVCLMRPDGSERTAIAASDAPEAFPEISADGRYVAYARWTGEQDQLVIAALDGSGERVIASAASILRPTWSPGGGEIAFTRYNGRTQVMLIGADGSNLRELTDLSADSEYPSWSPDGSLLVYHTNAPGYLALFVMNADGSDKRPLPLPLFYSAFSPVWR